MSNGPAVELAAELRAMLAAPVDPPPSEERRPWLVVGLAAAVLTLAVAITLTLGEGHPWVVTWTFVGGMVALCGCADAVNTELSMRSQLPVRARAWFVHIETLELVASQLAAVSPEVERGLARRYGALLDEACSYLASVGEFGRAERLAATVPEHVRQAQAGPRILGQA